MNNEVRNRTITVSVLREIGLGVQKGGSLVEHRKGGRGGSIRCQEPLVWDPWSELYQKRVDEIRRAKAAMSFKRRDQSDMDGAIAIGYRFRDRKSVV